MRREGKVKTEVSQRVTRRIYVMRRVNESVPINNFITRAYAFTWSLDARLTKVFTRIAID